MFDTLTDRLLTTLRSLSGKVRLSEELIDEVCRQLRTNLLEADVDVKVVKDFIQSVRSQAIGVEVQKSMAPEQRFIQIVYEELRQIMGGKASPLNFKVRPPAIFLLVGLQGVGKTTTAAKLAKHIKTVHKKSVLVTSVDTHRPAAREQLQVLCQSIGIDFFECESTKPRERTSLAEKEAIRQNAEVLIVDTAGRLHIDAEMMAELESIHSVFTPAETLLVVDSMVGQTAVEVATEFHERLAITGLILTKLDGDARGGAALSLRAVTGLPIKLVGTGEKPADLEVFHPDRLASRILDMGDLLSLAEKAQHTIDADQADKIIKKARKNDFTLQDFYAHLQQIKKMGSFENLIKFLPGMGQVRNQLSQMAPPDTELRKLEAIILSMTPRERINHQLIDGSRRKRIAAGSGTRVEDVNRLVKQFMQARKMMTRLTKSNMGKRNRLW